MSASVIPAKAGIQSLSRYACYANLDSRVRGNDDRVGPANISL
jgi:hypothetical protein